MSTKNTEMAGRRASAFRSDSVAQAGGLRILIVEDNMLIALDTEMSLIQMGHDVVGIAATASEGVELAERHRPDLALVDLKLADGSRGEDVAADIFTRLGVRSMFASGSLSLETRAQLSALEPVAFIDKPFSPSDLEHAIFAFAASGGEARAS